MKYLSIMLTDAMYKKVIDDKLDSSVPVQIVESIRHGKENRWIPVTKKLPKDRDWYLGIFKEPDTGWVNPLPYICDYVGHETAATTKEYWILRGFTDRDEHIDYYFNLECVKWMPLPSSYSYERGDEE